MRVATQKKPLPLIFISITAIGILILFIPPAQVEIVCLFFFFASLFIYSLSRFFVARKFALLLTLCIISFLSLLAIGLFDTINAILLASLFVGLFALIK